MADFRTVDGGAGTTVGLMGDALPGGMYSCDHTLGAADTVTSFAIPDGARGFRVVNGAAALRVALNADPPAANVATSGTSVAVADLGAYNLVQQSTTEVRVFDPAKTPTTLRVNSDTGGATFTLEFF